MRRKQLPFCPVPPLFSSSSVGQDSSQSWSFILCDDHRINFTKFIHQYGWMAGWLADWMADWLAEVEQMRQNGRKFLRLPLQLIRRTAALEYSPTPIAIKAIPVQLAQVAYAQYLDRLGRRPRKMCWPCPGSNRWWRRTKYLSRALVVPSEPSDP